MQNQEFSYEVMKQYGVFSENRTEKGVTYAKEVNLISYRNGQPVIDIRNWIIENDGRRKMGKGITMNRDEMTALCRVLDEVYRSAAE